MKYTNVLSLPPAIVVATIGDSYDKGDCDYSVTELLKPPRLASLLRRHRDDLIVDVANMSYAIDGREVHALLERASRMPRKVWQSVYEAAGLPWDDTVPIPELIEERFIVEIDGVRVSGCPDSMLLHANYSILEDYKNTTVYKFKSGAEEWEVQLNLYRLLISLVRGKAPEHLRILARFRDWSKRRARWSNPKTYPQYQTMPIEIPVWSLEQATEFLRERIRLHREADACATGEALPPCTAEERWERPSKWAVVSPTRKRAVKLCDSEAEAEMVAVTVKNASVVFRPGEPVRCLDYCDVGANGLCSQWNAEKAVFEAAAPLAEEQQSDIE